MKGEMPHPGITSSLTEATLFFDETVSRRETLIKESREVISLSSKAIVSLHVSKLDEARKLKDLAKQKLIALRKVAGTDLTRYLTVPEQEFVECSAMLAMASQSDIPTRKQLGVAQTSYILGLLDSIGELKRSVYDSIRSGKFESAEKLFSTMEELYLLISPFAVYDNIVQGVRRKLDVGRILIEDTRTIITEETRRRDFISAVNNLSERLKKTEK
jgi:translin